ncbi:MAG: COQ9 family protein [Pseudomonadota bacterium]
MMKTPEELRPELIAAALPHVAFDGWTMAALKAAAADLGVDEGVARLSFPGGGIDMVDAYFAQEIAAMEAALAQRGLDNMKIRDRVTTAVRVRLEIASAHKQAALRASHILALPQHGGHAARILWRTVDAMWRAAGDRATDFNHYSKRAILAGVYGATWLFWLNDASQGHEATWAFLDRRIQEVMAIEKAKAEWRKTRARLPSLSRFLGRLRYPAA